MNQKSLRGSLLLLLGSVIWGAAFAAQRMGMDHVQPFTFSGVRMLLAGLVMIPAAALAKRKNGSAQETAESRKEQRKGGLLCGLLLFAATSLQQTGLVYTSAGKAGFITALYVVLVPVAGWLILRKQPGKVIWAGVGIPGGTGRRDAARLCGMLYGVDSLCGSLSAAGGRLYAGPG